MQDRFKFRGYWYNDVQKEWWVFNEPQFITGDGTAEIWSDSEGGAYPELPPDAELHLCQCTGLKDKNGKLIYESDYVRYAKNKYRVEIDKFLGITLTNILNGNIIVMDDTVLFNCEVIGNEFESKPLFKTPGNLL